MATASARMRFLFLGVGLAAATASAQPARYTITSTGMQTATGINASGQVIGSWVVDVLPSGRPVLEASRWTPGVGTQGLGALSGHPTGGDTSGNAINDAGSFVGYEERVGEAYRWTASTGFQTLPAPAGQTWAYAYGINNAGQAIGVTGGGVPVLWDAQGTPQELAADTVRAINDQGQVVGTKGSDAYVWTAAGGFVTFSGGGAYTVPVDINEHGRVVGYYAASDGSRDGFLWTAAGGLQPFDFTLPGTNWLPTAINDGGTVVGSSDAGFGFVWTAAGGVRDLNTLLDPSVPAGTHVFNAVDINNAGQIVSGAAVLNPVPEPATLALFALGTLLLTRRAAAGRIGAR